MYLLTYEFLIIVLLITLENRQCVRLS